MEGTVLVADDDRTIRTVLTQALTRAGCRVHATSSLTTLMRWVDEGKGDVVITDVVMPDGNGLEMLPKIAQVRPGLPVIVVSAQNTIMTAIQASEAQAFDYMPKPFDLPDLMKRTARALSKSQSRDRPGGIAEKERPEELPLIGRTPVMQALYQMIARVMNSDLPLMITGESGTGKSLIARTIHDFSDRRALPFVTVAGAELDDPDGAARLLARAQAGTLLIEEVGDLGGDAQGRLVRMMDAPGDPAVRFMATTQKNMAGQGEGARLRSDLYYRLNGVSLDVPALRERVADIPLLARFFLARAEAESGNRRQFHEAALEALRLQSWPGNVRQLENTVRRLALTAQDAEISEGAVAQALSADPAAGPADAAEPDEKLSDSVLRHLRRYFALHGAMLPPPGLYARILREIELPLIEIALDATGGNQAKCADLLGINRNTLRKKITDLDIQVTRRRKLM